MFVYDENLNHENMKYKNVSSVAFSLWTTKFCLWTIMC